MLPMETKDLYVPPVAELAKALEDGLKSNFDEAFVTPLDCPDLSQPPYNLAAKGICGNTKLIEVGSPKNLTPLVNRSKIYDFPSIIKQVGFPKNCFILGAGAGSFKVMGVNSELMPNLIVDVCNNTHVATVDRLDQSKYILEKYSSQEFALLANLFASEGSQSGEQVLHVKARSRTGKKNFVSCLNQAMKEKYGSDDSKVVGMGGVFTISEAKIKAHVMPDFSETPLLNDDDVNKWLNFYDMEAPLTCLSVIVSGDLGLELRQEHTHFFSDLEKGCGGHYHYDLDGTKNTVIYEGYFNVAHSVSRVDRP